jgi:hypothetical protein
MKPNFEYGSIDGLLTPPESVAPMERPERGSQQWAYGYTISEINDSAHTEGDSVVLTVEPQGAVEPVVITGDITLTIKALKGAGLLVRWNNKEPKSVDVLPVGVGHEAISLVKGDAYYYLNTGVDSELVVRDDRTPAFQPTDEVRLTAAPKSVDAPDGRTIKLPPAFWLGFQLIGRL